MVLRVVLAPMLTTKAEDTDTALWSKAVQLHSVEPLCEYLKPQADGSGSQGWSRDTRAWSSNQS
jgi:hypothetical protein